RRCWCLDLDWMEMSEFRSKDGDRSISVEVRWAEARLEAFIDGTLPDEEARRVEYLIERDAGLREQARLAMVIREHMADLAAPPCPPEVVQTVLATAAREATLRDLRPHSAPSGLAAVTGWLQQLRKPMLRPALAIGFAAALLVAVALVLRLDGRRVDSPSPVLAERTEAARPTTPYGTEPSNPAASGTTDVEHPTLSEDVARTNDTTDSEPAIAARIGPHASEDDGPVPQTESTPNAESTHDASYTSREVEQALEKTRWAIAFVSEVGKEARESIRKDVLRDRVTRPI